MAMTLPTTPKMNMTDGMVGTMVLPVIDWLLIITAVVVQVVSGLKGGGEEKKKEKKKNFLKSDLES